ncbi:PREDICTED: insulin-like growth factor-binding protein 3 [Miniopterus natalensis]|uniref:insulin-like growth factor-binding protein 3 n=1 Tax=Miniopterus natalensis TaxID=291302 RepID=UPI0007A6C60E|nr:PREDICTED: insulin-like growth factor-binding protein 3 [Miniopterus natalensis]
MNVSVTRLLVGSPGGGGKAGSRDLLLLRQNAEGSSKTPMHPPGFCPRVFPGNGSEPEEEPSTVTARSPAISGTHRAPDSKFHPGHTKIDVIRKGQAKDSQRYKVDYEAQSTVTQNFSSESKQDTEYGPCRREMEDTMNQLKFLNTLSPKGIHIPNCDRKGFYKKKQCRPSKGRRRGFCWCVDKYGQPLPGYDPKGKGDVHCDSVESK